MAGFTKKYADFIAERIGDKIAWLRANNAQYSKLLEKRAMLVKLDSDDLAECKRVLRELEDINSSISIIENNFLFLMGMQEQKNICDALTSPDFINELLQSNIDD